jgi:polyhydroxyalkanoate synthesis regulator phasin
MTFEEMQQTLEQMLAVQRELQNSQLRLLEAQERQQGILDQLVGYSLSNESDHLDLQERLNALEQRLKRLEDK